MRALPFSYPTVHALSRFAHRALLVRGRVHVRFTFRYTPCASLPRFAACTVSPWIRCYTTIRFGCTTAYLPPMLVPSRRFAIPALPLLFLISPLLPPRYRLRSCGHRILWCVRYAHCYGRLPFCYLCWLPRHRALHAALFRFRVSGSRVLYPARVCSRCSHAFATRSFACDARVRV